MNSYLYVVETHAYLFASCQIDERFRFCRPLQTFLRFIMAVKWLRKLYQNDGTIATTCTCLNIFIYKACWAPSGFRETDKVKYRICWKNLYKEYWIFQNDILIWKRYLLMNVCRWDVICISTRKFSLSESNTRIRWNMCCHLFLLFCETPRQHVKWPLF